ncbi:unnamed protein product [Hermetia illucens]|uniref:Transcription factor CBF/NF-Y/archaeal histone domain-containing protein n=1 Tax=Hermetia illucens TaxID=343691 RepID=A0A7R8UR43_HERIL|nr:nuclear transcription factor Y subunit B-1 [Hermetia illucens]CAD7085473.1 unnamed protein product [Hermetia illucens]
MNQNSDAISSLFSEDNYMLPDDGSDEESTDSQSKSTLLREQDRFLPICNIVKIMKKAIPENGKIAKDARECIQECVSEFISFITSEAIDRSHSENRKTVNGDDILHAMQTLGFDNYVAPLTMYLQKYRESTKSDRNLVYPDPLYYEDSSNEFSKDASIMPGPTSDDSIQYYPQNFNL